MALLGFGGASYGGLPFSVQHVSGFVASGNSSANITISSVDTTQTILIGGQQLRDASVTYDGILSSYQLTSATNIQLLRTSTDAFDADIVNIDVVTFRTGSIKSIQYLNIALAAGAETNTGSITAVDTSKSFILLCGETSSGFTGNKGALSTIGRTFASSTSVQIDVSNNSEASNTYTYKLCVVEGY